MVKKLTFNSMATALVGIPAVNIPIAGKLHAPSKLKASVALCFMTKLHILEWPFIVPNTRCTCVMIMLFNQVLDMPHLSGGYFSKGAMLTVNKFVHKI